jgi:hypothetical protein
MKAKSIRSRPSRDDERIPREAGRTSERTSDAPCGVAAAESWIPASPLPANSEA